MNKKKGCLFDCLYAILSVMSILILLIFISIQYRHFYKVEDMEFTFWSSISDNYIMPYKYYGITAPKNDYVKIPNRSIVYIFIGEDSTLYFFHCGKDTIEFNLSSYKYKNLPDTTTGNKLDSYIMMGYPYIIIDLEHLFVAYIIANTSYYKNENFKYGVKFNKEREKIGLPILPENWGYVKSQHKGKTNYHILDISNVWVNLTRKRDIPFHYSKKVVFDKKETFIKETDEYVGPKRIEIGDSLRYRLYITYSMEYNMLGIWEYEFSTAIVGYRRDKVKITKESADSILTSWGIQTSSLKIF